MSRQTLFLLVSCFGFYSLLPAQIIIEESFNSGIPSQWSQTSYASDGGWLYGNADQLDSDYWPIIDPPDGTPFIATNDDGCDCDKSEDYLILPAVNFRSDSEYAFMEIEYVFRGQSWTNDDDEEYTERLFLKVSQDGGLTWDLVEEIPGNLTDNWRIHRTDLSEYINLNNVIFAFHYFDDGGWTWGAALNQVKIVQPYTLDASIKVPDDFHPFKELGKGFTLLANFENRGIETINNIVFDLIGPNGDQEFTFNYDLDVGESLTLQFQDPIILDSATKNSFSFKIKQINGSELINTNINTNPYDIYGVENPPLKRVFIENLVGMWCGSCPLAYVYADYINNNYAEHSSVSNIHLSTESEYEPLELIEYSQDISYLVYNSPLAIINRKVGRPVPYPLEVIDIESSYINVMRDQISPIGIEIIASNNGLDQIIEFDINLSYHTNISDIEYNVLFLVNQNNISSLDNGYLQNNDFSGSDIVGLEYWSNLNNPAEAFTLNNVLHQSLFSDFSGFGGIIPNSLINKEHIQFGASFNVPEHLSFEDFDFHLLVTDTASGEILNSATVDNIEVLSTSIDLESKKSSVFAFQDGKSINLNLTNYKNAKTASIFSLEGNVILNNVDVYNSVHQSVKLSVNPIPTGIYIIILNDDEGKNVSKQLIFYH